MKVSVRFCSEERGPNVFARSFAIEVWTVAGNDNLPIIDANLDEVCQRTLYRRVNLSCRPVLDMYIAGRMVAASPAANSRWHS